MKESIDTILEFIQAKEEGRLRKLYVMGCLSQRYQKELEEEMLIKGTPFMKKGTPLINDGDVVF